MILDSRYWILDDILTDPKVLTILSSIERRASSIATKRNKTTGDRQPVTRSLQPESGLFDFEDQLY